MSRPQQTQKQLPDFRGVAVVIFIIGVLIAVLFAFWKPYTISAVSLILTALSVIGLVFPLVNVNNVVLALIPWISVTREVENYYQDSLDEIGEEYKHALVVRTDEWLEGMYIAVSAWVKGKKQSIPPNLLKRREIYQFTHSIEQFLMI